ncbi:hypothetical protein BT93_L1932 [Corymbia citriodora subsp. variegata]|uniref:DUF4283 domain-containing protein n=1 Tax=Corymbia citriodora subsp. variegata TaxID=360336 RepID=A0A8T0CQV8_CORYI|nr:hypothetical protein BT93_L1932 [Corymbia citriodora subsp. variegata]
MDAASLPTPPTNSPVPKLIDCHNHLKMGGDHACSHSKLPKARLLSHERAKGKGTALNYIPLSSAVGAGEGGKPSSSRESPLISLGEVGTRRDQRNQVLLPQQKGTSSPAVRSWANVAKSATQGYSLSYIPHTDVEENVVHLSDQLLAAADSLWKECLVGYFIGKKLPFKLIETALRHLWGHQLKDIKANDQGFYFFHIPDHEFRRKVAERGPITVAKVPLILQQWRPLLELRKGSHTSVLVWVRLKNLPYDLWSAPGISAIASCIGKPLYVDQRMEQLKMISFARVCVEISATKDRCDSLKVVINGEVRLVEVEYEWKLAAAVADGETTQILARSSLALSDEAPTRRSSVLAAAILKAATRAEDEASQDPARSSLALSNEAPTGRTPAVDHSVAGCRALPLSSLSPAEVGQTAAGQGPSHQILEAAVEASLDPQLPPLPRASDMAALDLYVQVPCDADTASRITPPVEINTAEAKGWQQVKGRKYPIMWPSPIRPTSKVVESTMKRANPRATPSIAKGFVDLYASASFSSEDDLDDVVTLPQEKNKAGQLPPPSKSVSAPIKPALTSSRGRPLRRRSLWNDLIQLSSSLKDSPWMVASDFNAILDSSDRMGSPNIWIPAFDEFKECLEQAELLDLRYVGFRFTWSSFSGVNWKQRKIDRVLVNNAWCTLFSYSEASFLAPGISDHTPMVVRILAPNPRRSPFKFFNMWMNHPDFSIIVSQVWQTQIRGSPMFKLYGRLKLLKGRLKTLNKEAFSDITMRASNAKQALIYTQEALTQDPQNESLVALEHI